MDYTIPVFKEIHVDAIPLWHVAEAMARKLATGCGKRKLHIPTLEQVRPRYETALLKDARSGALKVCDIHGNPGTAKEIISTAEGLPKELKADTKALFALHVKVKHLADWAEARGDTFTVMDVPVSPIEFWPERCDGTKEYRGYVYDTLDLFGNEAEPKVSADGTAKNEVITRKDPVKYRAYLLRQGDSGATSQEIAQHETEAGRRITAVRVRQLQAQARSDVTKEGVKKTSFAGMFGAVGNSSTLTPSKRKK